MLRAVVQVNRANLGGEEHSVKIKLCKQRKMKILSNFIIFKAELQFFMKMKYPQKFNYAIMLSNVHFISAKLRHIILCCVHVFFTSCCLSIYWPTLDYSSDGHAKSYKYFPPCTCTNTEAMLLTSTPHCLDQIHVWSFSVLFMGISGTDHSTQWHGTFSSGDDCQCFTLINYFV